jgi:hypothetical protein
MRAKITILTPSGNNKQHRFGEVGWAFGNLIAAIRLCNAHCRLQAGAGFPPAARERLV